MNGGKDSELVAHRSIPGGDKLSPEMTLILTLVMFDGFTLFPTREDDDVSDPTVAESLASIERDHKSIENLVERFRADAMAFYRKAQVRVGDTTGKLSEPDSVSVDLEN